MKTDGSQGLHGVRSYHPTWFVPTLDSRRVRRRFPTSPSGPRSRPCFRRCSAQFSRSARRSSRAWTCRRQSRRIHKEAGRSRLNQLMKEQIFRARFGMEGDELRATAPLRVDDPLPGQHVNRGLFTSLSPEWPTPGGVFQALDRDLPLHARRLRDAGQCQVRALLHDRAGRFAAGVDGNCLVEPALWPRNWRLATEGRGIGREGRDRCLPCAVADGCCSGWHRLWCMQVSIFFVKGRLRSLSRRELSARS